MLLVRVRAAVSDSSSYMSTSESMKKAWPAELSRHTRVHRKPGRPSVTSHTCSFTLCAATTARVPPRHRPGQAPQSCSTKPVHTGGAVHTHTVCHTNRTARRACLAVVDHLDRDVERERDEVAVEDKEREPHAPRRVVVLVLAVVAQQRGDAGVERRAVGAAGSVVVVVVAAVAAAATASPRKDRSVVVVVAVPPAAAAARAAPRVVVGRHAEVPDVVAVEARPRLRPQMVAEGGGGDG